MISLVASLMKEKVGEVGFAWIKWKTQYKLPTIKWALSLGL